MVGVSHLRPAERPDANPEEGAMQIQALEGKHILVLGGSTGIGYATAEYLLRTGAVVTVCARRPERLEVARQQLAAVTPGNGGSFSTMVADATDPAAVEAAVAAAADQDGQLEGAFVTAGDANYRPMLENTVQTVQDEFEINMYPLVNLIHFAAPRMMRSGGSIVAVSSVASILSSLGIAAYGAVKAGLDQYVRFAADELGEHGIRVNAVRPGLTKNGREAPELQDEAYLRHFKSITPLGAYGLSEDFAPMVSLLLSRETRWITGQVMSIDGGFSLRGHGGGSAVVMSAQTDN
jgi:NAD(P)-dependent dehydrogenase (short-subunit alcohol dehydrogenase family)